MNTEVRETQNTRVANLLLPARLEISNLEALLARMQTLAAENPAQLVLDAGQVTVVDSAGVQLLVAFIRSMAVRGCIQSWDNFSVQVYQMASELGLAEQLGD